MSAAARSVSLIATSCGALRATVVLTVMTVRYVSAGLTEHVAQTVDMASKNEHLNVVSRIALQSRSLFYLTNMVVARVGGLR